MADPLSVTSNGVVAGTAASAAALAATLYDRIARDTRRGSPPPLPRALKDVAGGVRDLSSGLRELRSTLQVADRGVFRSGLFASIHAAAEHVDELLERRIPGLVELGEDKGDGEDGGAEKRASSCASWKARVGEVLGDIDSLKLAVGLITSMMLLVREQDKRSVWTYEGQHPDEEDERLLLRRQVETLVQATKQSIQDASLPKPTRRNASTQTDERRQQPSPCATNPADAPPMTADQPNGERNHSTEVVERWCHRPREEKEEADDDDDDDAVRWLYRFVFRDVARYSPPSSSQDDDPRAEHALMATLVSESSKVSGWEVVDRLLRSWSRLNEDEIRELRDLSSSSSSNSGKDDNITPNHGHGRGLTRASVHQMVSKALSYAAHSDADESSNRGDDEPSAQLGSRRRTSSQEDDENSGIRVTQVAVHRHTNKVVGSEGFGNHKRHGETQQQDRNSESRSTTTTTTTPPTPSQLQNTSRHRSKPASWVLGPRRARSRSPERRGVPPAAPSSSSSSLSLLSAAASSSAAAARPRFIGWMSSQHARRSLETPAVSSSLSYSANSPSIKKGARHSPPQKVLFTSPVARVGFSSSTASSSPTATIISNAATTAATRRSSSSTSSTTRTPTSPSITQPTKGILKLPTTHFPEEANPVREGVAPHRSDKTKKDAPPGAKWTKIKRSWVNPEALAIGKERFEVLPDHVKVLRVLSREEIQAYRVATAQLRAMKEEDEEQQQQQQQQGELVVASGMGIGARERRKRSGDGSEHGHKEEEEEREGGRYVVQGGSGRTRRKRSPSPRRRRESGDVPWIVPARPT